MFCSKCGAKVIEGAVFCEKCGAKLNVAAEDTVREEAVQTDMGETAGPMASEEGTPETFRPDKLTVSEPQKFTGQVRQATSEKPNTIGSTSDGDIYVLIQKNAPNCSEIKKVNFQQKMGITMLKGKKNRYFVGFLQGDYRLSVCPKFLLSIHRIIFWFAILVTVALLVEGIDLEEIYPLLVWCLLIGGVGGLVSEAICKGEKKKVVSFIKETLSKAVCVKEPVVPIMEPLLSHPRLWFLGFSLPVASVIQTILYSVAALAGAVVLIVGFGVLDGAGSSGRDETVHDTYNDKPETETDMLSSGSEDISLNNLCTNEEEGFSFMYPDGWEIESAEEIDPDALASVACTSTLGVYARIAVYKEVNDGSYFIATWEDFEEAYSSTGGLDDGKLMDLSDIMLDGQPARKVTYAFNNDMGVRLIGIQYFYVRGTYMYLVTYAVEEVNYDRYEPIFNAIMDSYMIAAVNDEYSVGMQMPNYENDYSLDIWALAGEYEGEDVRPSSYMYINIYSSPEDDMVGNYCITIPNSGIEYTGELCRESDRTFSLVSNGEIYAMIDVIDETYGSAVIHYSENDFECNYCMYEAYPMP